MRLPELRAIASPAAVPADRLEVTLQGGPSERACHFQSRDVQLVLNSEALASSALLLGMLWGLDVRLQGPVSERFLKGIDQIGDVFHSWRPDLKKVTVTGTTPIMREGSPAAGVGLFFSAGVDSFFSLLKHRDEITHLILIRGFEFPTEDEATLNRISALVHGTAAMFGLRVVEVATTLRPMLTGEGLSWVLFGGAAVKASVAHLLSGELKRIYIASGETYADLGPRATHPLLDPLWSSEALEFVHDGAEASRLDKLRRLAEDDSVLQSLHVCNERPEESLNCGRCEKCVRTMLKLSILGALDRCPTFGEALEPRHIARVRFNNQYTLQSAMESLEELQRGNHPRAISHALQKAIGRSQRRVLVRQLLRDALPGPYARARGAYHALLKAAG